MNDTISPTIEYVRTRLPLWIGRRSRTTYERAWDEYERVARGLSRRWKSRKGSHALLREERG